MQIVRLATRRFSTVSKREQGYAVDTSSRTCERRQTPYSHGPNVSKQVARLTTKRQGGRVRPQYDQRRCLQGEKNDDWMDSAARDIQYVGPAKEGWISISKNFG